MEFELPPHARHRYTLTAVTVREHVGLTITEVGTSRRVTHEDYQHAIGDGRPHRVLVEDADAVLRGMVRLADAGQGDDGIAAIAAGALALECNVEHLRRARELGGFLPVPALVDPGNFATVFAHLDALLDHLSTTCEGAAAVADEMAELADIEVPRGARWWREVRDALRAIQTGVTRASVSAERGAVAVGAVDDAGADATWFTCGDCVAGDCHWGSSGGRTREQRAADYRAAGEECGCARHEVSVAYARLARGEWAGDTEARQQIVQAHTGAAALEVESLDLEPLRHRRPAGDLTGLGLRYEGGAEFDPVEAGVEATAGRTDPGPAPDPAALARLLGVDGEFAGGDRNAIASELYARSNALIDAYLTNLGDG